MASLPMVASVLGDKYGVKVTIGGKDAFTNGKNINIPALPLDCNTELLALARGFLDHEAAHIRHTDFGAVQAAQLTLLQKHLWNTLEDRRVENALAALYPGCRQHFNWLILHHFGEEKDDDRAGDSNPALSVVEWILLTVRAWDVPEIAKPRDRAGHLMDMTYPGLRTPLNAILSRVRQQCRSTQDTLGYALELSAIMDAYARKLHPQKKANRHLHRIKAIRIRRTLKLGRSRTLQQQSKIIPIHQRRKLTRPKRPLLPQKRVPPILNLNLCSPQIPMPNTRLCAISARQQNRNCPKVWANSWQRRFPHCKHTAETPV